MIKTTLSLLTALLLTLSTAQAANAPGSAQGERDYQFDLRLIKELEKYDLMAEYEAIDTAYNENYRHYQLGGRYLLSNGLKLGLHLRYLSGKRHDDDWVPIGGGIWKWRNTRERNELEFIPELDYKKWLFNSPIAASFRARYIYNEHNSFQSALLRVGVLRFWEKLSFSAQLEGNFPLNYSSYTIDEYWFYLGVMFPITQSFTLGHTVGVGQWRWSEPDNYPGTYRARYKSTRFNLFANFYF